MPLLRRGVLLAATAVAAATLVAPLEAPAAGGEARAKGGSKVVSFSQSKVPLRRLPGARRSPSRAGMRAAFPSSASFAGLGQTDACTFGGQCGAGWPAEAVGDANNSHYVQAVNSAIGIWTSAGTFQVSIRFNDFWAGQAAGTPCADSHRGDAQVAYDQIGGRFVIADVAYTGDFGARTSPTYHCIAVSQNSNPQGSWFFYAIATSTSNNLSYDDIRLGIWPDGIYWTSKLLGADVSRWSALNRADAEAGSASPRLEHLNVGARTAGDCHGTNVCGWWQPAHVRGATAVASTRPIPMVRSNGTDIQIATFSVNWNSGAAALGPVRTLTATDPTLIPACSLGDCTRVAQPGTTAELDTRGRMLGGQNAAFTSYGEELATDQRRQYLWVVAPVYTSFREESLAVHWLQLNVTNMTFPAVSQQDQTGAPSPTQLFAPSVAADKAGGMALGENRSSPNIFPSLTAQVRTATEAPNTLGAAVTLLAGARSQTAHEDWGGTAMTVAPDGCTFWFTGQYVAGASDAWGTRIAKFALPQCTETSAPTISLRTEFFPNTPNGWFTASTVPVIVTTSDNTGGSGLVGLPACSVDGGALRSAQHVTGNDYRLNVTGDGVHEVDCKSVDRAGNTATSDITVKMDATLPAATVDDPASIIDPIVINLSEPVSGVGGVVWELTAVGGGARPLEAAVCHDGADAQVFCGSNQVEKVILRPRSKLLLGREYDLSYSGRPPDDEAENPMTGIPTRLAAPTHADFDDPGPEFRWGRRDAAEALGGDYRREQFPGAIWSRSFDGTSFTWFTVKGPAQGRAVVSITNPGSADGRRVVDTYAPEFSAAEPVVFDGLPAGPHVISVRVLGQRHRESTGNWIALDGYAVGGGPVQDDAPRVYHWADFGPGSYAFTGQRGAFIQLPFYGTQITWTRLMGSNNGTAKVAIDGSHVLTDDLYDGGFFFAPRTISGLTEGRHTLSITVDGRKNPSSSDTIYTVQSFDVG